MNAPRRRLERTVFAVAAPALERLAELVDELEAGTTGVVVKAAALELAAAELAGACTCYLGDPTDPTRDEEACHACDAAFWADPVFSLVLDEGDHL